MNHATLIQFSLDAIAATSEGKPVIIPKHVYACSIYWQNAFNKFALFQLDLIHGHNSSLQELIRGKVFSASGNSKLPFLSFSSMALADCPGKGDCASFCYSKKAWRNIHPYFKQLRNSLLMRFRFDLVEAEFARVLAGKKFASQETVEFRLFVDGDFDSMTTLQNWMGVIRARPNLKAYGYSKSWDIMVAFPESEWPANYTLNLSSGSKYHKNSGISRAMESIPPARGWFLALGKKPKGSNYGSKDYRAAAKAAAKAAGLSRFFICPGLCGSCTKSGAYCESSAKAPAVILTH